MTFQMPSRHVALLWVLWSMPSSRPFTRGGACLPASRPGGPHRAALLLPLWQALSTQGPRVLPTFCEVAGSRPPGPWGTQLVRGWGASSIQHGPGESHVGRALERMAWKPGSAGQRTQAWGGQHGQQGQGSRRDSGSPSVATSGK